MYTHLNTFKSDFIHPIFTHSRYSIVIQAETPPDNSEYLGERILSIWSCVLSGYGIIQRRRCMLQQVNLNNLPENDRSYRYYCQHTILASSGHSTTRWKDRILLSRSCNSQCIASTDIMDEHGILESKTLMISFTESRIQTPSQKHAKHYFDYSSYV